jgi:hypothetical protein
VKSIKYLFVFNLTKKTAASIKKIIISLLDFVIEKYGFHSNVVLRVCNTTCYSLLQCQTNEPPNVNTEKLRVQKKYS